MSKLKPPVNENDQQTANVNTSITLVEYGDYQCPHCGHAHPLLKRFLKEYGNDVNFVFRNFPLQEIHPAAHISALAAEAAGRQGRFWEMHDMIFEHQQNLNGHTLLDFAERLSLDIQQFSLDWKNEKIVEKVEKDFESGIRSGVNGTPTFFVNGEKLMTYDGSYESLVEAINILR